MTPKRISLALQGGGAHGAFTWGVLDRILEDDEIEIAAITGTSAGALNGAAVKAGLARGSRQDARENLDWMWEQLTGIGSGLMAQWLTDFIPTTNPWAKLMEATMPFSLAQTASQMMSPYFYGPLYVNPMKSVVDQFNFDTICSDQGPRLFICATRVRDGKARIFTRDEITTDSLLASACLPTLFKSIEMHDSETGRMEAFWDGGYSANPALFPLMRNKLPEDIVIVNINPMQRDEVPMTPLEIQNRVNEISFNAALLRELQTISSIRDYKDAGHMSEGALKNVHLHMISDDALMRTLSLDSKALPDHALLRDLKQAGREATDRFIEDHKPHLGKESTIDLAAILA